jgi:hypothetical protein
MPINDNGLLYAVLAGIGALLGKIGWDNIAAKYLEYRANKDTVTAKISGECEKQIEILELAMSKLKQDHAEQLAQLEKEKNEIIVKNEIRIAQVESTIVFFAQAVKDGSMNEVKYTTIMSMLGRLKDDESNG